MTTTVSSNLEIGNYNKNVIINGNFDIWQRGTSSSVTTYLADRWKSGGTGSTKLITRESFAVGQTVVPNNPKYYARTVISVAGSAAGDNVNIHQRIENVSTFAGETITLSFWAKADSNKTIVAEFTQYFGTGGSPSAPNFNVANISINLTTSWVQYTLDVDVNNISGLTVGTDGNDYLRIMFWFAAGTTYDARTNSLGHQTGTFDIAQVQLEKGSYATNFELRSESKELALCQRYFEKTYNTDVAPATITNEGRIFGRQDVVATTTTMSGHNMLNGYFKVTKRGNPTMTSYNPVTGTVGELRDEFNSNNYTVDFFYQPSEVGFGGVFTVTAIDSNKKLALHWTADAEL